MVNENKCVRWLYMRVMHVACSMCSFVHVLVCAHSDVSVTNVSALFGSQLEMFDESRITLMK